MKTIMFLGFTLNFEGSRMYGSDRSVQALTYDALSEVLKKTSKHHSSLQCSANFTEISPEFAGRIYDLVVQPILFWTSNSFQEGKIIDIIYIYMYFIYKFYI